jgi:hypothetical protein
MPEPMDSCVQPALGPISGEQAPPGGQTLKPGPRLVGKVWQEWKPEMAF